MNKFKAPLEAPFEGSESILSDAISLHVVKFFRTLLETLHPKVNLISTV